MIVAVIPSRLGREPGVRRRGRLHLGAGLQFILTVYDDLFSLLQTAFYDRNSSVDLSDRYRTHFRYIVRINNIGKGALRPPLDDGRRDD